MTFHIVFDFAYVSGVRLRLALDCSTTSPTLGQAKLTLELLDVTKPGEVSTTAMAVDVEMAASR